MLQELFLLHKLPLLFGIVYKYIYTYLLFSVPCYPSFVSRISFAMLQCGMYVAGICTSVKNLVVVTWSLSQVSTLPIRLLHRDVSHVLRVSSRIHICIYSIYTYIYTYIYLFARVETDRQSA